MIVSFAYWNKEIRMSTSINIDAIRRKVQELQTGRKTSNVQLWKPKIGEYRVRGIAWPAQFTSEGIPLVERFFYYIGDGPGMLAPYQFGKPDPINDFVRGLYQTNKPEDRLLAKKLKAKMRAYLPVVVKEGAEADPKRVLVWSFGKTVHQKLLSYFLDADVGDWLDPVEGFDLNVKISNIEGRKFFSTDVDLARKPSKLASSQEEIKALMDSVPNIDEMYRQKSPQELETALHKWLETGVTGDDDSDGSMSPAQAGDALDNLVNEIKADSDEKPKKATKAPKKAKEEDDNSKSELDKAFDELMSDD